MKKATCKKCFVSHNVCEAFTPQSEKASCPDCGMRFSGADENGKVKMSVIRTDVDKVGHFVYDNERG